MEAVHPHEPNGELTMMLLEMDAPEEDDRLECIPFDGEELPLPEPPARRFNKYIDALRCPQCGKFAKRTNTRWGRRDDCKRCNLWSWNGKPLASKAVHDAKKARFEAER
jgi:hypothetical protein